MRLLVSVVDAGEARAAAAAGADIVIVTSDNPRSEIPAAIIDEILPGIARVRPDGPDVVSVDRTDAIREAISLARAGDVVVIAGKGHESGQEFSTGTVPFDDRLVARAVLEEQGWSSP